MANLLHLAVCALLFVGSRLDVVDGLPLGPEDVASLLPDTPKTKNETVAAIVQDTVIQQAVQSIVGNGTLSGLVVKKNTVILPADQPHVVLSHNEQILRAPVSQLENIRKNITEAVAATAEQENSDLAEVEEIAVGQIVPEAVTKIVSDFVEPVVSEVLVAEKPADGDAPHSLIVESLIVDKPASTRSPASENSGIATGAVQKFVVPGIVQSTIQLPEGVFPQNISLPSVIDDKISRPVVAVLHPEHGISLLPHSTTESTDAEQNLNPDSACNGTLVFGDRIPVAVIPEEEKVQPAVELEVRTLQEPKTDEDVTVVFTMAEEKDSLHYETDDNDMVAAEDIVFRPLFRYRQQENERTRILQNRRNGYNRYRPSPPYYDNYGYPYRRPKRPRYYNDYDR